MRKVIEAGICGTEIGLPIDKENCEGTDVGGVATPTGSLKQKPKTRELFEEDEDKEESKKELKDNSGMVCPECGSKNVNVHNKDDEDVFFCTDCNYKWSVEDADDNGKLDSKQDRKEIQGNIIKNLKDRLKKVENKVKDDKGSKKEKGKEQKKEEVKEGMELSRRFKVGKEYSTKGNKTFIIKKVVGNNVQIYDVDAGENVIVKAEFLNKLENVKEV